MAEPDAEETTALKDEARSEQIASGLAGGAAIGAVAGLVFLPAAPLAILASSALTSAAGGFLTRKIMKDAR